jgi:hypothetical protein
MCEKLKNEKVELPGRLPEQVRFSKMSAIELNGAPESWHNVWDIDLV